MWMRCKICIKKVNSPESGDYHLGDKSSGGRHDD